VEEPIEMTHSAQVIDEICHSGVATIKELAFWGGAHENTVYDYRTGRIKFFGSEMRFWNGVVAGLCSRHAPAIPPIVFRIVGMLLKNSPLTACEVPTYRLPAPPLGTSIRRFADMTQKLGAAMEASAAIFEDGRVTAADDPNIAEVESNLDQIISAAWQIKHGIAGERQKASAK